MVTEQGAFMAPALERTRDGRSGSLSSEMKIRAAVLHDFKKFGTIAWWEPTKGHLEMKFNCEQVRLPVQSDKKAAKRIKWRSGSKRKWDSGWRGSFITCLLCFYWATKKSQTTEITSL